MSPPNLKRKDTVVSDLRDSNIAEYVNIMSDDEVIRELLKSSTNAPANQARFRKLINSENNRKIALNAVADVLQSITVEAFTTSEMLEMLYEKYDEEIIEALGDFIKIVHAKDYKINNEKTLEKSPFSIKYEAPNYQQKTRKYKHNSNYGLLSGKAIKDTLKKSKKKKIEKEKLLVNLEKVAKDNSAAINKTDKIYNIDSIINRKISSTPTTTDNSPDENQGSIIFVNKTKDSKIIANKSNPSLSYILVDNADLRIGTRNSLELSTFFNTLSTIELSKCQPYFNAVFVLPGVVSNDVSKNTFKTASITQFFDGTPLSDELTTDVYKTLEASFVRTINSRKGKIDQDAVATNLAAFTMPQTINKFDDVFVGHNESVDFFASDKFKRATSVHDYTRPFLTIKSFDIDVAPTQGLMSFKTGKLSLVLHDRTRMVDIAPFIKPDLFGSFGAEIAIEYGWSHIDAGGNINYLGDFLNKSRVTEKYIITNSSFSMDKNGQVNIDLSIAMRGPIDIKGVMLKSDPPGEVAKQGVSNALEAFNQVPLSNVSISINELFNAIRQDINTIQGDDTNAFDNANLDRVNKIARLYRSSTIKKINKATSAQAIQDILNGIFKKSITGSVNSVTITIAEGLSDEDKKKALSSIKKIFANEFNNIIKSLRTIKNQKRASKKSRNNLIKKIMGGLDIVDPFYNKEWLKQFTRIKKEGTVDPDKDGLFVAGIGGENSTKYVTLGSFVTGLIGTHMACTGKFDEVQIISYTANEYCGLFSNLNVSSLLLPRDDLRDFLDELFKAGTSMSIESILSQTIQRFISTRLQICYGLESFYERDAANNTVMIKKYRSNKESGSDELKVAVDRKLVKIYELLARENKKTNSNPSSILDGLEDVKFVMPKVKFTFDTITSRKSGFQRTICRISIFDQNDNPFGSVHTIMKKLQDEKGIIRIAAKLNKLRAEYKSKEKIGGPNSQKRVKEKFYKKQNEIFKRLEDSGMLIRLSNDEYTIKGAFQLDTIKNSIKNVMPSITYGTQNSAIIDASVTTVNEAKLNTVYLTRSDRNAKGKQIAAKVQFQKDLPLRVLPSQATITTFGCPFVNFAQYMFLDFETGTTIDNAYAVTGIKHSLTPGKFTTSLTLSYGDVYGKYENAAKTISREIEDKKKNQKKSGQPSATEPSVKKIVDFVTTNPSNQSLEGKEFTLRPFNVSGVNITKKFYYYSNNLLYLEDKSIQNITLHNFVDFDNIKDKKVNVNISMKDKLIVDGSVEKIKKAILLINEIPKKFKLFDSSIEFITDENAAKIANFISKNYTDIRLIYDYVIDSNKTVNITGQSVKRVLTDIDKEALNKELVKHLNKEIKISKKNKRRYKIEKVEIVDCNYKVTFKKNNRKSKSKVDITKLDLEEKIKNGL